MSNGQHFKRQSTRLFYLQGNTVHVYKVIPDRDRSTELHMCDYLTVHLSFYFMQGESGEPDSAGEQDPAHKARLALMLRPTTQLLYFMQRKLNSSFAS